MDLPPLIPLTIQKFKDVFGVQRSSLYFHLWKNEQRNDCKISFQFHEKIEKTFFNQHLLSVPTNAHE